MQERLIKNANIKKVKSITNNEIYEVISEAGDYCYLVQGNHLGIPFYVPKNDCEIIK